MPIRFFLQAVLVGAIWLPAGVGIGSVSAAQTTPPPAAASSSETAVIVTKYCVTCHNDRLKTGGLTLDTIDFGNVAARADVLEKAVRKVRVGMMPPQGANQPDAATRTRLVASLTDALDRAASAAPNPGRPLLHRLNRAEYANAVRDLLALRVDPATLLPPDDSAYGFDNIGDVLGMSPVLLERYMDAAGKVSALAVGDPDVGTSSETFRIRQDASQDIHLDSMPLGTIGGIRADVTLPLDGEYMITVQMFRTNLGVMRGLEYEHEIEYTVDAKPVHRFKMGGEADFKANLVNMTKAGDVVDERGRVRLHLTAGPHVIAAAFVGRSAALNPTRLQPFIRSSTDTRDTSGHPHFDLLTVTGPFNPTGPGDTPSRRRILTCKPAVGSAFRRTGDGPADQPPPRLRRSAEALRAKAEAGPHDTEDGCAAKIIATLARRAFRGDVTAADRRRLLRFYREGRRGANFERGIEKALQRILASPKFAFHLEQEGDGSRRADGAPPVAGSPTPVPFVYRITDLELASRLSFFLWSSIPDDPLLTLAEQGQLHTPTVLEQQVRRMLADPKAAALTTNFAGQWLYLRNLKNMQPHSEEFPDFDDNLRQTFEREASLFFESIVREDHNVIDLMTADYTFVNARLAKHYGIPNVYGSQFRRVTLTDDNRRGLLGKGAILMVTSHTDRTSPVVRGKWVLDNLLGAPPPAPPAVVPPFNESAQREGKILSMRERMEEHRANPVCANCHKLMDPIGLSLENFDAVGAWRVRDGDSVTVQGTAIDASGQLLDGTKVTGVATLRQALLRQPEIFVSTVTEKLLTYALGRGVQYYDMPAVRAIVREAARNDYRFSALVLGIVNSTPFQKRMVTADDRTTPVRAAAN